MGFKKSCLLKHYRKNSDIFSISNKTENYWNWKLFFRKFKKMNIVENNIVENNIVENHVVENHIVENNIVEHNIVENKTHPTATMIKESFLNIGDGDCMGFQKSYFLKRYSINGDVFSISNRTENYWNWNLFLRKFKRL